MEQHNIHFEKKESLYEIEGQVEKEQLIICDDIQNTFLVVTYNDNHNIGVAYYDYGIKPVCMYSQDDKYLYLGVAKKIISIDVCTNIMIENNNLQSIFYEFICDSKKNYICAICELDVYCYCKDMLKWKIGFKDIIIDYSVNDDSTISIKCDNGEKYLFSLEDGKILE